MSYVVDTCIINKLIDGKISLDTLPEGCSYFASHIQIDEINNTKNAERRAQLFLKFAELHPEIVPTESGVWGAMRWGYTKWSDGELYSQLKNSLDNHNNSKSNNINDALIAEIAIKNGYVLLTADRDLAKVAKELGCKIHLFESD